MTTHTQVSLEREGAQQIVWIETRGAKAGNLVELKESGEFWKVTAVYGTIATAEVKKQERNYTKHRESTDI